MDTLEIHHPESPIGAPLGNTIMIGNTLCLPGESWTIEKPRRKDPVHKLTYEHLLGESSCSHIHTKSLYGVPCGGVAPSILYLVEYIKPHTFPKPLRNVYALPLGSYLSSEKGVTFIEVSLAHIKVETVVQLQGHWIFVRSCNRPIFAGILETLHHVHL